MNLNFKLKDRDKHLSHSDEIAVGNVEQLRILVMAPDDSEYNVILTESDESFDIEVLTPDGENETVWSMPREA